MTIEEQKKYLFNRLKMERLCASDKNKKDIESFEQSSNGDRIAQYLKNEAWDDDKSRNTKVYIVRDTFTKEIAYYFAVNCGILYSDIEEVCLNDIERAPFLRLVNAVRLTQRKERLNASLKNW